MTQAQFEDFTIVSQQAYVASAHVKCGDCRCDIQVICIYCESGTDLGEPLTQFTVADIWAVDDALAEQLLRWPFFNRGSSSSHGDHYANHCVHCGAEQEDFFLHAEPGEPFFSITSDGRGGIELTPLAGRIELSGDCHFQI